METVLITGANRGIGLALVSRYLAAGNHVVATCREPDLAVDLKNLQEQSAKLEVLPLETTSEAQTRQLVSRLSGRRIDVLINNAGVMGGDQQELQNMDYAAWLDAFAVNTMAPFRLSVALLDNLLAAERPRIITVSSQMGALARQSKGALIYRSSKAAVNKTMQVLALELEAQGIIVCPVHPGWVQTDMGGAQADITPAQSADGLYQLIDQLDASKSGRFWSYDGSEHPW
ncbi:MAG: SDR family oxidoreductase [Pseudomonadaceae bacterium]|nr:SDR family oxidoreductase [Pseudomonadaceae bacterium]